MTRKNLRVLFKTGWLEGTQSFVSSSGLSPVKNGDIPYSGKLSKLCIDEHFVISMWNVL